MPTPFEPVYNSRRSAVFARRGMTASSQPLASQAGLSVLMEGGNAADAAVAMAAMLNLTEPSSTGIGGDCFALYYEAKTKAVTALNGSGRAPAALSLERLEKQQLVDREKWLISEPYHAHCVTVPGACAGWCDLLERHGSMPRSVVLMPAIYYAENGFPVAPITSHYWSVGAEKQLKTALNGQELTIDGRGPKPGEVFRNRGLGRTFRAVAEGGKEAFYNGEIGRAIVNVIREAGGVLSEVDLAEHRSTWDAPISTTYRGHRLWECPPNGHGIAALIALNILEGFDLAAQDRDGAARWHVLIEAMRCAFADTSWHVADPKFAPPPIRGLLDKRYAAERRKLIDPARATADIEKGTPQTRSGTVYFCAVDCQGNACSMINSNYLGFGTGIVPKGFGFTLQNRGYCFSTNPEHPNKIEPRKRPYHTIIPGMITREGDGSLYAPFGVMGGAMQPQGHMQVAVALFDDKLDPQAALDRPRFCINSTTASGTISLEEGIAPHVVEELKRMGHPIGLPASVIEELKRTGQPIPDLLSGQHRSLFGRGQIIHRREDGVLCAGSDPRADGCAIGF
jgi:gamma-glutamyltranspeptidase/glutathione hydrolase